jgi:hypothetical protein
MARKVIDIGTIGNDGTGDSIRDSFRKVNDNFRELYSSLGLGEKLTFQGLDDTPNSYLGRERSVVVVKDTEDGVNFRNLIPGSGIQLDFDTNPNAIIITNLLSDISGDFEPNLGGPLNARSGITRFPIGNLPDLANTSEIQDAKSLLSSVHDAEAATSDRLAANKGYVDTKISLAGVETVDPEFPGVFQTNRGRMTGPLVLSRNPEPDDDIVWDGLVAATKNYVDNSGFGSSVNLYVATSGSDVRPNIRRDLEGRSLATAYRTIEAACKRAEEILLESPFEIGPYKKVLTFGDGANQCTLKGIGDVAGAGDGFSGQVSMSVDTVVINSRGSAYLPGDLITIVGGTSSQACVIQVLSVVEGGTSGRGPINTVKLITQGVYTSLPTITNCTTTATSATGGSTFGTGATFDLTFNVNNVQVVTGGSGYGLVSVRFIGGGGGGAFGRADIVGGIVAGVTVVSRGSGFTSLPNVILNLPRFFIETGGLLTDFTGIMTSSTPAAIRTRDIREGLFLRGETSGALAQILSHSGELSTESTFLTCEVFDVDIVSGEFIEGEVISYGDSTKTEQICIFVEAGIYEENYPLKLPQNVALIGDEFRRTIIRPKPGESSSPWAFQYFRRDLTVDGITTASQLFGYHYLADSSQPVYPLISNRGNRKSAAELLDLNRNFIAEQVIGWINNQISNNIAPFTSVFSYNQDTCQRDVGLIVDALVFDLKYGGYNRTISAALKYKSNPSALIAITTQLSETVAGIQRINTLALDILSNTPVSPVYTENGVVTTSSALTNPQVVDLAYVSETGASTVTTNLINGIVDVISNSGSVNYPRDNNQLDVFLCNDANIVRAVTCQGHGGFMMVLDPEGQILAKSPYCQESASFSRSTGRKTFAGGLFVDGFTGNQQFTITAASDPLIIEVSGLLRLPNVPCSFIVNDQIYRINYVRNYIYSAVAPTYGTATFVLDETTPWPFGVFTYDDDICSRDVGLIVDGLGFDIVFQTNYHARKAGLSYRQANAEVVVQDQLNITLRAITYAHDLVRDSFSDTSLAIYISEVTSAETTLNNIIENGALFAPSLVLTNPPGVSADVANAKTLLLANVNYIADETIGWINAQIAGPTAPFTSGFVYDSVRCARDTRYIVEAVAYDLLYGGNSQTRDAALKYYDGVGDAITLQLAAGQEDETAAAVNYVSYLCQQVAQDLPPAVSYSATARVSGTGGTGSEATIIGNLLTDVATVIVSGVGSAPALTLPNLGSYSYNSNRVAARTSLQTNKSSIQTQVIDFVDTNANLFEILMPGNRSMLSNDFTQVNDLGYGLIATNGGLTEAVSMFTYYCEISYYAINGAQIRSVGGSSAHGNFALVAEGADPLEVPTPVTLYHALSQGGSIKANTVQTANDAGDTILYVNFDDYMPLSGSEVEVRHPNGLTRYAVSSVTLENANQKLARLTLSTSGGLEQGVPHGSRVTIRQNAFVVLTGDVVEVATRPSTALVLNDSPNVYRVIQFNEYDETFDADDIIITAINLGSGSFTTNVPHRQQPGYQITFFKTQGTFPSDLVPTTVSPAVTGDVYYVKDVISATEFTVSETPAGEAVDISAGPAYSYPTDIARVKPYGLALTQLRENYDYIELTVFSEQPYRTPSSLTTCTISAANPTVIGASSHGLVAGTQIKFSTTGTLPADLEVGQYYWVVSKDNNTNDFKITGTAPVDSTFIGTGATLTGLTITGLDTTEGIGIGDRLVPRANITVTGASGDGTNATITFAQQKHPPYLPGQVINVGSINPGGYNDATATVISCTTTSVTYANATTTGYVSGGTIAVIATGNLGTDPIVAGIPSATSITITNSGGNSDGSVVFGIEGLEIGSTASGSGTHSYGLLIGDQGQSTIAIADLSTIDDNRTVNTKFIYLGTEYTVTNYQTGDSIGQNYSLITVSPALDRSVIDYNADITLKSGVQVPTIGSRGTLTIRIALTRVTSHDLLEIGTGSYADTNYPSEIYGAAVNDFNAVSLYNTDTDEDGNTVTRSQVQERGSGRVFFVTTDQYGNFSVGPFFKVDQGTGTVTFSASIALSQLDGLGFKRGATISEFSIDDSMADAAIDAVPTESAVRGYIDRRLGVAHDGSDVLATSIIPGPGFGFMALTGQLAMKGDMDLANYQIKNLATPTLLTDAARLDDIKIGNLKDNDGSDLFTFTEIQAGQLLAVTGDSNEIKNFTPTGDVVFDIQIGDSTTNIIRTDISPGVIVNADVNASAAIDQSKLNMTAATTRANATGIAQADRGLASFDSAQFNATNGWITVKDNGLALSKLPQVNPDRLLGNSGISAANVAEVAFTTVVDEGGSVKKSQFSSGVGYLKRTNATVGNHTDDSHYSIVNDSSTNVVSTLVRRDTNGDFAGRVVSVEQLKVDTVLAIDTNTSGTGGFMQYYGFLGQAGILIGDGTTPATDKFTYYDNDSHVFRTQNGVTTYATIDANGLAVSTLRNCTAITTGSDTTAGTITGQWTLASTPGGGTRGSSRLQATYAADLAEFYEGDREYDTGTVLIFGGDKEVTISSQLGDTRVAGVVSDNAAYSMYGACPGLKNQIALQGRVPCKVVGKIRKGDLMITSNIPGVAISAGKVAQPGTIIGKAIEDYDSDHIGTIIVAVGRS